MHFEHWTNMLPTTHWHLSVQHRLLD